MTRIFLVGTARAGTTLLQGMLGSHPQVFTLPETHFLDKSFPKQPWLRFFHLLGEGDRLRIRVFLETLDAEEFADCLPKGLVHDKRRWTAALLTVLDALARREGKAVWLEKTPLHLYYTDLLQSVDPGVRILHILRDPVDNIASLVDAGRHHSEAFRQGNLEKATGRWIFEYKLQKKMLRVPGHYFVRYEQLLQEPERLLRGVLSFLGLNWDPAVLGYSETAKKVIASGETWKDRNTGELSRSGKAAKTLTRPQIEWIEQQTRLFTMEAFTH